jgi:hypothetical protein
MINSLKAVVVVGFLVCLSAALPVRAQAGNCQSVRILLQANLDLTSTGVPWSGQVRGFLNENEPLIGTLTYLPEGASSRQTGQAGHESNDRAVFDFGQNGVLVTEPHSATFPLRPGVGDGFMIGSYMATAKVAPDPQLSSGRFKRTTGNISIDGPFIVDGASPSSMGIWNAEIKGKLCNVQ